MRGRSWAMEEAEKGRLTLAWYVASLQRSKRIPDLDLLLSGGELPEQDPVDMLEVLRMLSETEGVVMHFEEVEAPPWLEQ